MIRRLLVILTILVAVGVPVWGQEGYRATGSIAYSKQKPKFQVKDCIILLTADKDPGSKRLLLWFFSNDLTVEQRSRFVNSPQVPPEAFEVSFMVDGKAKTLSMNKLQGGGFSYNIAGTFGGGTLPLSYTFTGGKSKVKPAEGVRLSVSGELAEGRSITVSFTGKGDDFVLLKGHFHCTGPLVIR